MPNSNFRNHLRTVCLAQKRTTPLAFAKFKFSPSPLFFRYVQARKTMFMGDIKEFLRTCFREHDYPSNAFIGFSTFPSFILNVLPFLVELESYLTYVSSLEFDTLPDYDRCRTIFRDGLKKRKLPLDGKVDFSAPKSPPKRVRMQTLGGPKVLHSFWKNLESSWKRGLRGLLITQFFMTWQQPRAFFFGLT